MGDLGRIETERSQVSSRLKIAQINLSVETELRENRRKSIDSDLTELEKLIKVTSDGLQSQKSAREFIERLETLRPSLEIVTDVEKKISLEEGRLATLRDRISSLQPLRKRLEFMVQAFSPTGMVEEALELLLPSINEEVSTI